MSNPTITLLMRGDIGSEIVNYGYVNDMGAEITAESDVQLTTRMTEYKFQVQEPKPPKAIWVEFTNDAQPDGRDRNVRMGGLWYDDIDMWDPTYEIWPGNDEWNSGGWEKGGWEHTAVNSGEFLWGGTYHLGINPAKIPTPPPPSSPQSSGTVWNPMGDGFFSMGNMALWVYIVVVALILGGGVYMFMM